MILKKQKGQLFSLDMIVAGIAFLMIILLTMITFNQMNQTITLAEEESNRNETSLNTAKQLLATPGSPANWENLEDLNNVFSLGIVSTKNYIDLKKMEKLSDLNSTNYNAAKKLLGAAKYGLKIEVIKLQDKNVLAEFGLEPDVNASVSSVNRFGIYNGQDVILRVRVFE